MDSPLASSASATDPNAMPGVRPEGWRGFFVDWLRYAALGLDVSLISAAELAQYFEQSDSKGPTAPH